MVGDRDRAEPLLLGGLEQQLRRGRAVRRVVGVHVQVAVDVVAALAAVARISGLPLRVVAPAGQPAVDGLDLVGHLDPAAAPRRCPRAAIRSSLAQRRVAAEPLQLRRSA